MMYRGPETERSHFSRIQSGFYDRYMKGFGLDIGYRGSYNAIPVLTTATGVDLDYPGYDGTKLPFDTESQDFVFSSHALEHVENPEIVLQEWFRVLRVGGYLVITVPHMYLYEKRSNPPSRWNADHKRFYVTQTLLNELDMALPINSWRLRHMRDNDDGFDYSRGPELHSNGAYEIECVIQKIKKPDWELA